MFPLLETILELTFRDGMSTLVALFSTVVLSSDRCPLSGFLNFGNSQKSQGAMSGLYGVVEAMQYCVYLEIAVQNFPNSSFRYSEIIL